MAVSGVGDEEASALPAWGVAAVDVGVPAGGHGHDNDAVAGSDGGISGVGRCGVGERVGKGCWEQRQGEEVEAHGCGMLC